MEINHQFWTYHVISRFILNESFERIAFHNATKRIAFHNISPNVFFPELLARRGSHYCLELQDTLVHSGIHNTSLHHFCNQCGRVETDTSSSASPCRSTLLVASLCAQSRRGFSLSEQWLPLQLPVPPVRW